MTSCVIAFDILLALVAADPISVDEALDAWTDGSQLLTSYDLYLFAEESTFLDGGKKWEKFEQPLRTSASAREVKSNNKRRIESGVTAPGQSSEMIHVWTGELSKLYLAEPKQLLLNSHIRSTIPDGFARLDYEQLYRVAYGSSTFDAIFRQRPKKSVEKKEGSLIVLHTPPISGDFDFSPFGFRVWLDADRNFQPVKIQHLLDVSGQEIVYVEFENTLDEVATGVWAVVKSVISGYPPIVKSEKPASKSYETIIQLDRKTARFNKDIPESIFELDVPVGVTVFDHVSGVSYTYGKAAGVASHLSELALQGKASVDELKLQSTNELRPDDSLSLASTPIDAAASRQTKTYVLIGINVIFVAVLAFLWWARRQSSQKSKV